jgi:hypothetical protein
MAKKLQDSELSVVERLEGALELMSWQSRLLQSALKTIQDQAGPGSGRRGSKAGSGRRT